MFGATVNSTYLSAQVRQEYPYTPWLWILPQLFLLSYRIVKIAETLIKKCLCIQLLRKYLLQLIYDLTAARQGDVADFVSDFLHVFHLFEFKKHGIVFHQFCSIE